MTMDRSAEVDFKIALVRSFLIEQEGVRLRGIDWFAWATAGASSAVLLAAETGIAEVLITLDGAWILTDDIEARRLQDEEIVGSYTIHASAWATPQDREQFVRKKGGTLILSDRPKIGEAPLPSGMIDFKRSMMPGEIERYRKVGRLAAEAMTETLSLAEPEWTEWDLAGAGADALLSRGIHPALVLSAGNRRLPIYRHPTPSMDRIGNCAMLVFCGRMYGLYANLTRFVSFGPLEQAAVDRHRIVREIEARVLEQSKPGASLHSMYTVLAGAYAEAGQARAIQEHHQGGTTGYLSREIVVTPDLLGEYLRSNSAVAWNPSIKGAKIEDTFLVTDTGLLNLTLDPVWPVIEVAGLKRPLVLER
ncbi:M24 family metallopeptidase [Pelotalea chapellei]|uniref:M24 family metallopeptidase n=1 Tax=Pelotalea chapellei TaxID=44671 RepID=A0ABS5UCN6_9BACT|nr:M24 family metallopeptidase [Pelotalea chapellei]MBT1073432.1 M24 family metallopeptidase [Pelotalea chapellei]